MKQGTRPTRRQKIVIAKVKLNPENWLVERETPEELVIMHRNTSTVKRIWKGA
ncbi:hypothetical protein PM3016_5460 [Paenibacillus mucilaginosus 3016]|uniref:DUF6906 domain-containing protein n=1 Tax=Paenibacillus mucilaginosus 3016 TaxID=1116391 RepID=H6NDW1_9BACL|nr:hypothetical protein [Paenibacillus mucilaginosus]AFC32160.1 hypothetical protein PM3016_5460 [Paenibacillus mucilaginosus 3016]